VVLLHHFLWPRSSRTRETLRRLRRGDFLVLGSRQLGKALSPCRLVRVIADLPNRLLFDLLFDVEAMGVVYCVRPKRKRRPPKRFLDPSIIYIGPSKQYSAPINAAGPSGHHHPPTRKTPELISRPLPPLHPVSDPPARVVATATARSRLTDFSSAEITSGLSVIAGRRLLRTKYRAIRGPAGEKRYCLRFVPPDPTPFDWTSAFLGAGHRAPIVNDELDHIRPPDDAHLITPLDSNDNCLAPQSPPPGPSDYSQRRQRYSDMWNELMPPLANVFLNYQASTCHGFEDPVVLPLANCACNRGCLHVTCVYSNSMY